MTVTDSRMLLGCEALEGTDVEGAIETFLRVFEEHGLPLVIRTDNGVPFASKGLWGLSKLGVLWLRLGILPERIAPASPQQNGQHERMHRDVKAETTRPAAANLVQQQERFDAFRHVYCHERPHEALGMRTPFECHAASPRRLPKIVPELEYPMHDDTLRVMSSGHLRIGRASVFLTSTLAGENVGVRELADGSWLVSFSRFDLGLVLPQERRFEAYPNPFGGIVPKD